MTTMLANDARRLIHTLQVHLQDGGATEPSYVLATVVRTAGSTYRKAGAMMLVPAVGDAIGILSGGCLEDDIIKSARALLADATARTRVLFFDLMPESEFLVGYGKGCSGQLTVLLERVRPDDGILKSLITTSERLIVGLVYEAGGGLRAGDRVILNERAEVSGIAPNSGDRIVLLSALHETARSRKSMTVDLPSGAKICVYAPKPVQDLVIFGAGPDTPALAQFADHLGWTVRVYDHRPARLTPERFPASTKLCRSHPEALGDDIATTSRTAVVVMTHNLLIDAEILKWAAARPLAYLGLLGPSHRRERIYRWLRSQGTDLEPALAHRLYAPIGLDLGSDGGEWEIALAITAQIQQLTNGASGAHKLQSAADATSIHRIEAPRDAFVVSTCALETGEERDESQTVSGQRRVHGDR